MLRATEFLSDWLLCGFDLRCGFFRDRLHLQDALQAL